MKYLLFSLITFSAMMSSAMASNPNAPIPAHIQAEITRIEKTYQLTCLTLTQGEVAQWFVPINLVMNTYRPKCVNDETGKKVGLTIKTRGHVNDVGNMKSPEKVTSIQINL